MILVVDASVACKWFIEESGSAEAANLFTAADGLIAPDLIVPEVCNALWRKRRGGEIGTAQATAAIDSLGGLLDDIVPGVGLAARSFAIAEALGHPVYDCFYLALAELRQTKLVTADKRLLDRLVETSWAQRAASVYDHERIV